MLCSFLLLLGCETKIPGATIDVELLTASGENPLRERNFQTAIIEYQQGENEKQVFEERIENENFSFKAPFVFSEDRVRMQITLVGEDPSQKLHGAAPEFKVGETNNLVKVILGEPGQCEVLMGVVFDSSFQNAGASVQNDFALVAGGENTEGSLSGIQFLDLLHLTTGKLPSIEQTLGKTKMVQTNTEDETMRMVGIAEEYGAFELIVTLEEVSFRSLPVHAGASLGSSLLKLQNGEVVIVGGGTTEQPAIGVTWIGENTMTQRQLATPRLLPSLVEVAGEVWVGFGENAEDVSLERIQKDQNRGERMAFEGSLEKRESPHLQLDPWTASVWIIGGEDQQGNTMAQIQSLRNCPQACIVQEQEPWIEIPQRPTLLLVEEQTQPSKTLWISSIVGNTNVIFSTSFSEGNFQTQALWSLRNPRIFPSAWHTNAGILWIAGGQDEAQNQHSEIEICFPEQLAYFD